MSTTDEGLNIPSSYWESLRHKPERGSPFEYASAPFRLFRNFVGPSNCFFCQMQEECFAFSAKWLNCQISASASKEHIERILKLQAEDEFEVCWRCISSGTLFCHHELMILGSSEDPTIRLSTLNPEKPLSQNTITQESQKALLQTPFLCAPEDPLWLVYQEEPMQYLGTWDQADFEKASPNGDGHALYLKMDVFQWSRGPLFDQYQYFGGYVRQFFAFQCRHTSRLAGYGQMS